MLPFKIIVLILWYKDVSSFFVLCILQLAIICFIQGVDLVYFYFSAGDWTPDVVLANKCPTTEFYPCPLL
jgi:hypothetical protein